MKQIHSHITAALTVCLIISELMLMRQFKRLLWLQNVCKRPFCPPPVSLSVRFESPHTFITLFYIPLFAALASPSRPARRWSVINIFVITQGRVTSLTTLKFLASCSTVPVQMSWPGKDRAITQNTKRAKRPLGKDVRSLQQISAFGKGRNKKKRRVQIHNWAHWELC